MFRVEVVSSVESKSFCGPGAVRAFTPGVCVFRSGQPASAVSALASSGNT